MTKDTHLWFEHTIGHDDTRREDIEADGERDCAHGQLKRSCLLCEKDAEIARLRGALITGASLLEQGCNAADMAASMRKAAGTA